MIEKKYKSTPTYGIIKQNCRRFDDSSSIGENIWKYAVLKKIQLWWGTPKK